MLKLGDRTIGKLYLGDTSISKAYLGNQLVYEAGGVIPGTIVDYIDSGTTTSNWFDLGITPDWSKTYEFETTVYDENYGNRTMLAALDTSPTLVWFFIAQTFNNKLDINYGTQGADDVGITCFDNYSRYKVRTYVKNGVQKGWVQDLTNNQAEILVTDATFPAETSHTFSSTLRLFNRTNIASDGIMQMGRTKLSINGVLAFDLVPVLTDENEYTFYNTITKSFLNKTGEFTGGYW